MGGKNLTFMWKSALQQDDDIKLWLLRPKGPSERQTTQIESRSCKANRFGRKSTLARLFTSRLPATLAEENLIFVQQYSAWQSDWTPVSGQQHLSIVNFTRFTAQLYAGCCFCPFDFSSVSAHGGIVKGRQFIFTVTGQKIHNNLSAHCNSFGLKEH